MAGQSHTAGPWWLVEAFDRIGSSVQRVYSVHANDRTPGGLPYEFAGLARVPACEGDQKLEANARLIAAAPELLEACRGALEQLRASDDFKLRRGHQAAALERAIAKATGEGA